MEMKRFVLILAALFWARASAEDVILVLRPEGPNFLEVSKGLQSELGREFAVQDVAMKSGEGASEAEAAVRRLRPRAVVLMDNGVIEAWRGVQAHWSDSTPPPPGIAMMAVQVETALGGLKNVQGISYDVPGLTIMLLLRSLLEDPVRRVGVIHTPAMSAFVAEAARWCGPEKITLVPLEIPGGDGDAAKDVRKAVWHFGRREPVDALWILNDNHYLNMDVVRKGWLPALADFPKPVVVGLENLVTPAIRFGTFAVLPDHYGLGVQAAGLVLNLKADGWRVRKEGAVEPPMAVHKILNLRAVRDDRFKIRSGRLEEMDKLLE